MPCSYKHCSINAVVLCWQAWNNQSSVVLNTGRQLPVVCSWWDGFIRLLISGKYTWRMQTTILHLCPIWYSFRKTRSKLFSSSRLNSCLLILREQNGQILFSDLVEHTTVLCSFMTCIDFKPINIYARAFAYFPRTRNLWIIKNNSMLGNSLQNLKVFDIYVYANCVQFKPISIQNSISHRYSRKQTTAKIYELINPFNQPKHRKSHKLSTIIIFNCSRNAL